MLPNSGNHLLVLTCGYSVRDTHRNSAAEAASYPGLPEERMPIGLVSTMAVVMALGVQRLRLRPPVPDASRRARSLALAARPASPMRRLPDRALGAVILDGDLSAATARVAGQSCPAGRRRRNARAASRHRLPPAHRHGVRRRSRA